MQAESALLSTWITRCCGYVPEQGRAAPEADLWGKAAASQCCHGEGGFIIYVLPVKLAANKLQRATDTQFIVWDVAMNSLGMLMALVSAGAMLSRHINTMIPKRNTAQERLKDLKMRQSALCLHEEVLNPACVFLWLDLTKLVLSDGFPFPLWWREEVRAAHGTQRGWERRAAFP